MAHSRRFQRKENQINSNTQEKQTIKFVDLKEVPGEHSIMQDLAAMLKRCAKGQAVQVGRDELPTGYGLGSMLKKLRKELSFPFRLNKTNDTVIYFIRDGGAAAYKNSGKEIGKQVDKDGKLRVEIADGKVTHLRGRYGEDLKHLINEHGELSLSQNLLASKDAFVALLHMLQRNGFILPNGPSHCGSVATVKSAHGAQKSHAPAETKTHGIEVTNGHRFAGNEESAKRIAALVKLHHGKVSIAKSSFKSQHNQHDLCYKLSKQGFNISANRSSAVVTIQAGDYKDGTINASHKTAPTNHHRRTGFWLAKIRALVKAEGGSVTVEKSKFSSISSKDSCCYQAKKEGMIVTGGGLGTKTITFTAPKTS